jgi:hypothetical protein
MRSNFSLLTLASALFLAGSVSIVYFVDPLMLARTGSGIDPVTIKIMYWARLFSIYAFFVIVILGRAVIMMGGNSSRKRSRIAYLNKDYSADRILS